MGHPVQESYKTDPLTQACEAAVNAGIVVVAAAGNFGKNAQGLITYGGITSPGNDPMVITVGAINTHGTAVRSDDTVATYSSRGPTYIDQLAKPDLLAPGNQIISVASPGSTLYNTYPQNIVSVNLLPYYFKMSGTSMSAPVVSGTVALMLKKNPTLTPNTVKAILMYTAQDMGQDRMTQGAGYLNSYGAVNLAVNITQSSTNPGAYWLLNNGAGLQTTNILNAENVVWGTNVVIGSNVVWGSNVIWGTAIWTTASPNATYETLINDE